MSLVCGWYSDDNYVQKCSAPSDFPSQYSAIFLEGCRSETETRSKQQEMNLSVVNPAVDVRPCGREQNVFHLTSR